MTHHPKGTDMTDTAARIRQILTEHLGVDEAPDTAHLAQDLQADSLDTIEIAMALEDAFGIELPDSAMENTATVAEAENARLRDALLRWQNYGCPDCGGDCASANPPVSCCIMRETAAATQPKDKADE